MTSWDVWNLWRDIVHATAGGSSVANPVSGFDTAHVANVGLADCTPADALRL